MSLTLTCPHCGLAVEDPRAEAAPDSALATCSKCGAKSRLGEWRMKPAVDRTMPCPPLPIASDSSAPKPSVVGQLPSSTAPQDATVLAGLWVAVVGLVLLNASYFLNWYETALGGTLGIADYGIWLLVGSGVALAAVVAATLVSRWWFALLSVSEAWSFFIATWCLVLFRRFESAPVEPQIQQFAFVPVVTASTILRPGAGLYLALFGSVTGCIAIAYVYGRRLVPSKLPRFALTQIGIGAASVALALLLLPKPTPPSAANNSASLYEQIRAEVPTYPRSSAADTSAPLAVVGTPIVLGNLEITPMEFTTEVLQETTLLGDPKPRDIQSVVFTFSAKNISEGQVFCPSSKMKVIDEHGNRCPDPLDGPSFARTVVFDQKGNIAMLKPGETAMVRLVFDPLFENAKEYTCEITTATSNKYEPKRWRVIYRPDTESP